MIDDYFKLYFTKESIEDAVAKRDEADRIYKERLEELNIDKEKAYCEYSRFVNMLSDVSFVSCSLTVSVLSISAIIISPS